MPLFLKPHQQERHQGVSDNVAVKRQSSSGGERWFMVVVVVLHEGFCCNSKEEEEEDVYQERMIMVWEGHHILARELK